MSSEPQHRQPDYVLEVWREPDGELHVEAHAHRDAAYQSLDAIATEITKAAETLALAVDLHRPGGAA